MTSRREEEEPLLVQDASSYGANNSPKLSVSDSGEVEAFQDLPRSVENNVLPEASNVGRHLSWQSAYILVISRVIGSGIFATPGSILRSAGSVGLSLLLWFVGAIISGCGLAVYLEYGCMFPRSGGEKVYLEFTYPRPRFLASTLMAVQAVLLNGNADNCIVFSQYALFALDAEPTDFSRKALAVGLLTAVTILHGCLPKLGVAVQNVLGWIKVALVAFMVFVAFFIVVFHPSRSASDQPSMLDWNELWRLSDWSWGTIATSLFKVFYSYTGLHNAVYVLNDVKDPVRTLKSVSIIALLTTFFLYTLTNIAYLLVVPLDEIKQSGELISALFFERSFGPNLGKRVLPSAVALSAVGNVMVVAYAFSRLNQEIARQGFLPFSEVLASSRPFNAPLGGLMVIYIPSFLIIVLPPSSDVYSFILETGGYPRQYFALALALGLIWLRFKRPDIERPFRAWMSAIVLMAAMSIALIAAPFFPPKESTGSIFYATYAVVGAGILLFGIIYWYVWTVLIPRLRGYTLEEKSELLDDGVAINKLVKKWE